MARIGLSREKVAERDARFDHLQHQRGRADLEHRAGLAHVGVADDDVQPSVLLGVGVGLVAGVDDRPAAGGGAGDAFPDVLGALGQAERRGLRGLQHLPAPQINWRVTRNGRSTSEILENSPARTMR